MAEEGKVHEVSLILGELKAHSKAAQDTARQLMDKLDAVEGRLVVLDTCKQKLEGHEAKLATHEGRLDDLDGLKNKAFGVGIAGGLVASFFGWLFK